MKSNNSTCMKVLNFRVLVVPRISFRAGLRTVGSSNFELDDLSTSAISKYLTLLYLTSLIFDDFFRVAVGSPGFATRITGTPPETPS